MQAGGFSYHKGKSGKFPSLAIHPLRIAAAYFRRREWLPVVALAAVTLCGNFVRAGAQGPAKTSPMREPPPYWAFAINPPAGASDDHPTPDTTPQHVPDSEAAFTLAQVSDLFTVPDWHPDDHPAMPRVVSHGRPPEVYACGYCHLPNGLGRPENASLAGLPAAYVVQQLADFKSGRRKSSVPAHLPTSTMIGYETKATQKEIQAAADYFSTLKLKPWIRVVETDTVPKTHIAGWMLVPSANGEMEPIGQRIIETPEDLQRTELRDDRAGFIAYVPVGSIKKGEALANGAGKTFRCATCHGPNLKGHGKAPPLAGRSPSYIVRQLYDIQNGARAGAAVHEMKPAVARLTVDDMLAIAAYTASLAP
jgi:cytochrome c553